MGEAAPPTEPTQEESMNARLAYHRMMNTRKPAGRHSSDRF